MVGIPRKPDFSKDEETNAISGGFVDNTHCSVSGNGDVPTALWQRLGVAEDLNRNGTITPSFCALVENEHKVE